MVYEKSSDLIFIIQAYTYDIPNANQANFWSFIQTPVDDPSSKYFVTHNRNFYVFGTFLDTPELSENEDTTITGLSVFLVANMKSSGLKQSLRVRTMSSFTGKFLRDSIR